MPDVDSCVRMVERCLCGNSSLFSTNISKIDNKLRVKVFRNKTINDIENILINCSNTIKTLIKNDYYNDTNIQIKDIILEHSSNNNKQGADLIHKLLNGKNINIEVKFGNETSKNIGMDVFNKIFDCVCFQTALSIDNRKMWRDLYFQMKMRNNNQNDSNLC